MCCVVTMIIALYAAECTHRYTSQVPIASRSLADDTLSYDAVFENPCKFMYTFLFVVIS